MNRRKKIQGKGEARRLRGSIFLHKVRGHPTLTSWSDGTEKYINIVEKSLHVEEGAWMPMQGLPAPLDLFFFLLNWDKIARGGGRINSPNTAIF